MKLLYFLGAGGVEYWRCRIPAQAMVKHGLAEIQILEKGYSTAKEIAEKLAWCDAVIVASPSGIPSLTLVAKYRSMGKRVFIDYDDYSFACSPYNPAYRTLGLEEVYAEDSTTGEKTQLWKDGERGFSLKNNYFGLKAVVDMLNNADLVTTTTLYLKAMWGQHCLDPEVFKVVPNALDFNRWKPVANAREKYSKDEFRIGYVCSASHAEDWRVVSAALEYFVKKHSNVKLVVMGDVGWNIANRFPANQLEWHGWSNLIDGHYQMKVATLGLDVAIMPLANTEFNRCKSNLKFVEMTAFGYPVIAQNCLPYTEDIVSGESGLLAGSTEEWVIALEQMRSNPALRAKCHFNALLTCKTLFDIDKIAFEWARVYQEALDRDKVIKA